MLDQLFILVIILLPMPHHPSLCILDLCTDTSPKAWAWISRSSVFGICVKLELKIFQAAGASACTGLPLTTEILVPLQCPFSVSHRGGKKLPFPLSALYSFPSVPSVSHTPGSSLLLPKESLRRPFLSPSRLWTLVKTILNWQSKNIEKSSENIESQLPQHSLFTSQ